MTEMDITIFYSRKRFDLFEVACLYFGVRPEDNVQESLRKNIYDLLKLLIEAYEDRRSHVVKEKKKTFVVNNESKIISIPVVLKENLTDFFRNNPDLEIPPFLLSREERLEREQKEREENLNKQIEEFKERVMDLVEHCKCRPIDPYDRAIEVEVWTIDDLSESIKDVLETPLDTNKSTYVRKSKIDVDGFNQAYAEFEELKQKIKKRETATDQPELQPKNEQDTGQGINLSLPESESNKVEQTQAEKKKEEEIPVKYEKQNNGWHWIVDDKDKGVVAKNETRIIHTISQIIFYNLDCRVISHRKFLKSLADKHKWTDDNYFGFKRETQEEKSRMQRHITRLRTECKRRLKMVPV